MTHEKTQADPPEPKPDSLEYYRSIQLTPAQQAELRARTEAKARSAIDAGVFEQVLALVGKVQFDMGDLAAVRKDRNE
ncbi:MAG TPA: hypothetical protein VF618_25555 [Thermoanaerobaculia bacterium]